MRGLNNSLCLAISKSHKLFNNAGNLTWSNRPPELGTDSEITVANDDERNEILNADTDTIVYRVHD